ncbi:hypothetical protein EDD22DRAFT_854518 [Suillus occidentalis]|nr:hypothetical protein EDD22DRAFT_855688 [Suillus occidentalis]KAG1720968.1 hypothetical protein EDD22DRAFT_854518 [Suillus occidentalis]
MTQALSARTQQDREGAVEQTWRTHKGDDDTSASSPEMPSISGVGREARSEKQTAGETRINASRLWCWAGSKSRLREKLECEMATTPVHSIRKAPETPLLLIKKCSQRSRTLFDVHARFALRPNLGANWHVRNIEPTSITKGSSTPKAQEMPGISGVGLEARSKFRERNWNFAAPETPRVSGVGREAKTDSERNSNVKWLRHQSIVLGKHVSGVGREAAADSKRIVGIDHCTALRPENERWITR